MRSLHKILVALVFLIGLVSYSQVNPYASAVWMKRTDVGCTNCDQFFNTTTNAVGGYSAQINAIDPGSGDWTTTKFHGRNFSSHLSGAGTLVLKGGEVKTIKTNAQNVCSPELFYKVNDVSRSIPGVFGSQQIYFFAGCGTPTPNKYNDGNGSCISTGTDTWQKWQLNKVNGLGSNIPVSPSGVSDMTARNEGKYELEIYYRIDGNNAGNTGCNDGIGFINDANADGTTGDNYIGTFTICPSLTSSSSTNPATCAANGTINMVLVGVDDGTYNDRFIYEDASNVTHFFTNVTVTGGLAVINTPAGVYKNIRYQWTVTGCSATTVFDVTLTDPTLPLVPTSNGEIQPTCAVQSGTITIKTQVGVEYSVDGITYQAGNVFSGLAPNNYILFVRNAGSITCITASPTPTTINAIPTPLTAPTASSVVQPTCAVQSGKITITSQLGVEYSVDGITYQASNVFSGLSPKNYTLFVRSLADGTCVTPSATQTTINAIPTPLTAPTASSVVQPTCAVQSGKITITSQIGVEYSVDGITYQASNVFSALSPKNYTLFVRSLSDGTCVTPSATQTTINAIPTPLTAPTALSVVQPTCSIQSGKITITSQLGVEYSVDGITYQASNVFSGLSPNNYTLFVRSLSDNTCVTPSATQTTINAIPTPLTAPTASSVVQPTCAVQSGKITITSQLGVEYSVDGITYQASNVFSGLSPKNYTLFVKSLSDGTCVTPSATPTTINAIPTPLTAPTASNVVQPTCGVQSGTITITAQLGVAYSVDGITYQASNVFSGLSPKNYTLFVRSLSDGTCVTPSSTPTTINAIPTPLTVPTASSVVQPTCAVQSGTITIAPLTGVEYSVDGITYKASNVFPGLSPKNYTLFIRSLSDGTCVTPSATQTTINAIPTPLAVPSASSVVQPTCAVQSGTITIVPLTGVEYSVDGILYQSNNVFAGLSPKNYTLFVRSLSDGTCVAPSSTPTTINAIPTPQLVPTASSVIQPTCAVQSGTITITSQPGVEYSVDGITYQASNVFSGLSPKNYTLFVRSLSDGTCVTPSLTPTTINAIPTPLIVPTASSVVQPTCAVQSGKITITSQLGVEYSVDGITYQASNAFSGLSPKNYTLFVRSLSDGTCVTPSPTPTTINAIPTPLAVPTASSVVQPTCAVQSGTITIVPITGVEYSFDGIIYQSSNVFSGLSPKNYTLFVRSLSDGTCVTPSSTPTTIIAIPTPQVVPTASSVIQPTCAIQSGTITITAQLGVEYSVDGIAYQASNVFAGLSPKNYTLFVKSISDGTCVTPSLTPTTINAIPTPLTVPTASSVVQPTCAVQSGTITIAPLTGVEYSVDGITYQASNVFSGLSPKNYTLFVRSLADGTCVTPSATQTTINAVPTPLAVPTALSAVQPTCAVQSGTITIVPLTGVEYSVDGILYQSSNVFAGLSPKNYTLFVRSLSDGTCVMPSSTPTTITAIPTPQVVPTASSVIQPTCAIQSGNITITSQSGVEYSVDGIIYQASNVFAGLSPKNYTLFVRSLSDGTCVTPSLTPTTVNAIPTPLTVPTASSVVQPTCAVQSGTITIAPLTGVEYSVDGIIYQASNVFPGLSPKNYTLFVRSLSDGTCVTPSATQTTINAIPTPLTEPISSGVVQPTCAVQSGTITIVPITGVEYSVDGILYQSSNVFAGLLPKNYTLFVRSLSDGTCVTPSSTPTIINAIPNPQIMPTASSVVQPTCAVQFGMITITSQSGVEYSVDGITYQASNVFAGLSPKNYTLFVRSLSDGTCVTPSLTLTTINAVPTPLAVPTALSVVQPTCAVQSGTITIVPLTGLEYSVDGITYQASNVFSGLSPKNYTLFVRSLSDGTCVTPTTTQTTINAVPTPLAVPSASSVVQPTCAVQSGTITIVLLTGVEYSVDGITYQASNVFSGLSPKNYTLFVRSLSDGTCVTSSITPTTINALPTQNLVPTASSVEQPTCAVQSGKITITSQLGVEYSVDGITYQASNVFSGLSPKNYTLFVRSLSDGSCVTTSTTTTTINAITLAPLVPVVESVIQPTCAVQSGTITITSQSGVEYSADGINYQISNTIKGLAPNVYTLYVRNLGDNTCITTSSSTITIDSIPLSPAIPTTVSVIQPTCAVQSGTIIVATQSGIEYSIGNGFQNNPQFVGLLPGNYTISVRLINSNTCITSGAVVNINPVPADIQFVIEGDCKAKQYVLTATPIAGSFDPDNVEYQWKDNAGIALLGETSNTLNVSVVIASTAGKETFPLNYSLTVKSATTGCETTSSVAIKSIFCDIQKGISPDNNGSNDSFDLVNMGVKKLEIFNRYGLKVYSQMNYTDQWVGQTNNGDDLPSATYYYVIEFFNEAPKTGWIYLIRGK